MDFGQYIKEIREKNNLSVRELAKRAGMSHPYLSQLENGKNKNPSPEIVRKLATGLDIDFQSLWIVFSQSVQGQYHVEQQEIRKKSFIESLTKVIEGDPETYTTTFSVTVPNSIEYETGENHKTIKQTKETDLFDLFYLLNMDTDLYYKEKTLSDEDKKFILQVLDRSFHQ